MLTLCNRSLTKTLTTVQILCIGTDRSQQTVQTKIRLLLQKQSDQSLRCLSFHQHLLDALMRCYIKLCLFLGQLWQLFEVSQILEFLRYAVYRESTRQCLLISSLSGETSNSVRMARLAEPVRRVSGPA